MTHYRIEDTLSGNYLGDMEADDEESAIRAMLEETACTDEATDNIRAIEVVTLGQWTGTLEAATYYMDEEIRERLQSGLRCSDQEWLDTYCREHEAAFGERFVIT
ncbi:MAG TPA: hypothetical protein PKM35_02780 [Holophaga sp.]|nr:hypothetical protein [Holophaga sp.]